MKFYLSLINWKIKKEKKDDNFEKIGKIWRKKLSQFKILFKILNPKDYYKRTNFFIAKLE